MSARCPACFNVLTIFEVAWMCTSSNCEPTPDQHATRMAGYDVTNRTIMKYSKPAHVKDRDWTPPPAVTCTGCGEWASARVCPYCHFGPLMPELL